MNVNEFKRRKVPAMGKLNPFRAVLHVILGRLPGGTHHCIACQSRVWRFFPYRDGLRSQSPLMQVLDMVGSDLEHYSCPRCESHDRERHLIHYLEARGIFQSMSGADILHFAPEKHLSKRILLSSPASYVKGDLYPLAPDIQKVDLLSLPFSDLSFDFVLANHVLEHVADDRKALSEIYRVLRQGGFAILQTPYSARLHQTWQDSGIEDDESRLQAYGQEDHVRLYGRDIFQRFTDSGLCAEVASHAEILHGIDARIEGVNEREPLFLFFKDGRKSN